MEADLLLIFSKVLRYQRGDQKSYIKEGQTVEWPIEKDKGTNNDIQTLYTKT